MCMEGPADVALGTRHALRSYISPSARCRAVPFSWSSGLSPGDTQVPCTKAKENFKGGKFSGGRKKKKKSPRHPPSLVK